jgi:ubiquinone/menaquinone biosynthesis C-methylase UbiE
MPDDQATGFIPALRFRALTRFYDPVVALTVRERRFKARLLRQAELDGPLDVLDLACGTGTLTVAAKRAAPEIDITGLDADPEILDLARAKASEAGLEIGFDEALSTSLPYERRSFDRVLSSLFFHHLTDEAKRKTLREATRVLRPGGRLDVADWGKPADPLSAALSLSIRALDGFEPTRANFEGRLPELFAEAGLREVRTEDSLRTAYGTLCLYSARKP